MERRGEGADESGTGGDLGERAEPLFARDHVEEARGDGLLRQPARRRHAFAGERGKREAIGERVEGRAPEAEERAAFGSELPEEVIRGLESGRNEKYRARAFDLREPPPRLFSSRGRPRCDHDAMPRHVDLRILASIPRE